MLNKTFRFSRQLCAALCGIVLLGQTIPVQAVDKVQWLKNKRQGSARIARAVVPQNGAYVAIDLDDDGAFTIGTVQGDPARASDDNQKLLYGHPFPGTSDTMVSVDSVPQSIHTGSSSGAVADTDSVSVTLSLATVSVYERLRIVTSAASGRADTVQIYFRVTNTDSVAHNVSLRTQLDTMLGNNDGAPFRIPNVGAVTNDLEFDNDAGTAAIDPIPAQALVLDNLTNPGIISLLTFPDLGFLTPDRVVFGYWPASVGNWDYTVDPMRTFLNSDSSVIVWWGYPDANAFTLAPGQSQEVAFLYGLGNCTLGGGSPLTVLFCGPAQLNGTLQSPSFIYTPLTVTAFISNVSAADVAGAQATLLMTPDFAFVPGNTANRAIEESVGSGTLAASASAQLDWQITSTGRALGRRQVSVQINTNGQRYSVLRELTVTTIPNAVYGQATDSSGVPVSGATISVFSGSTIVGTATTQADGSYAVSGLSPGAYTVRMSRAGQPDSTVQAVVSASDSSGRTGNPGAFSPAVNLQAFSYPNPAREGTAHITFYTETAESGDVKIFTSTGQLIKTIAVPASGTGWHSLDWEIDGVANGVYFYLVTVGSNQARGKIAVLKRRGI